MHKPIFLLFYFLCASTITPLIHPMYDGKNALPSSRSSNKIYITHEYGEEYRQPRGYGGLHKNPTLPGTIEGQVSPEKDETLESLKAIQRKYTSQPPTPQTPQAAPIPQENKKRRKSLCVFTQEETPRLAYTTQATDDSENVSVHANCAKPLGKRYSVTLSEISDHSGDEEAHTSMSQDPIVHSNSLTTRLSVQLSPYEKDTVEKAIDEIHDTNDPVSKAEKQNMLLLNVTFQAFQRMQEQMQETAQQTQKTLEQLQTGIEEMRRAQKRQRRLNYFSVGVGICGFSLFLINFIMQQMQSSDSSN